MPAGRALPSTSTTALLIIAMRHRARRTREITRTALLFTRHVDPGAWLTSASKAASRINCGSTEWFLQSGERQFRPQRNSRRVPPEPSRHARSSELPRGPDLIPVRASRGPHPVRPTTVTDDLVQAGYEPRDVTLRTRASACGSFRWLVLATDGCARETGCTYPQSLSASARPLCPSRSASG